jgi:GH15 family glucan-1,4-alpha-glucosidase
MVRYLPLGNGRVLVSFDRDYRLVDFYFSGSQAENHAMGHPFRQGIWVNGKFSWINASMITRSDYMDHTMVGLNLYEFEGISFRSEDFVDIYDDVYVRRMRIKNSTQEKKEIRIFLHQNFYIYGNNIGDTAMFYPEGNSVVHYKGRRYFLSSTVDSLGCQMDQYAMGVKDFLEMEGTWKDAEDGVLSMNPVAIGSVDSVIRHTLILDPGQEADLFYYIACGRDLDTVSALHKNMSYELLARMELRTENYWRLWSTKTVPQISDDLFSLYRRSLFIIRSHLNDLGGILASSDSDILKSNRDGYYYVWPRDAAIAAFALIRANHQGPARKFFDFSRNTISKEGYYYHKYLPDGKVASSWLPRIMGGKSILPIQQDETNIVLWALWKHFTKIKDIEYIADFYEPLVLKAAKFILDFRDSDGLPLSSFDLWEERYGVHAFTVVTAYAALRSASRIADTFGDAIFSRDYNQAADQMKEQFEKKFFLEDSGYYARAMVDGQPDRTVDSAITSTFLFGMKDARDSRVESSMKAVMSKLWVSTTGGIARYENDYYQRIRDDPAIPGNPWIITTLWAAQYYLRIGDTQKALELINWVVAHRENSGILSEQINPYDGTPLSVSPLVWSHAQFVITMTELERVNQGQRINGTG